MTKEQPIGHSTSDCAMASAFALLLFTLLPSACIALPFICTDESGTVFKTRQRIETPSIHCDEQQEDERPSRTYLVARPVSIFFDEPARVQSGKNSRDYRTPPQHVIPDRGSPPVPYSRAPSIKSSVEIDQLIVQVARQYGHEVSLLRSIIYAESRFNPNARSPKGAVGLMQIIPATARRYGVMDGARELYDPYTNLHIGARYLADLKKMFPQQLPLVVAAYNAGENAVLKYGRVPPYAETQSYVRQVLDMYERQRAATTLEVRY